jgi:nitric oxide reductase NorE protein
MGVAPAASGRADTHLPGEEGVWVFIGGDLVVFAIFFLTYTTYRAADMALYLQSQALLNRSLGLLNTFLLLTGSLFVAQALRQARKGAAVTAPLLLAAIACGGGFCVVKAFEYGAKISAGITLNTNEFFIFYYMFTGIHLVHVLIGLGVLTYLWNRARTGPLDGAYVRLLEGGGAFWHLVDLLWVVLFALFYLMR